MIFVIKFVKCKKFIDVALFFFLIIISYVTKCFRGGTYPEIPSFTLMNKCTKFGAFIHYVHNISLSHLTNVHAPQNRHLCRYRGPHKTLSHQFSSVYWNNPPWEHVVESEHSFVSTLGLSRKVKENGGWGYIATVNTCSKTQNFIRYADVHQMKLAQQSPQVCWSLPSLNRTHPTKIPIVPDVCHTCLQPNTRTLLDVILQKCGPNFCVSPVKAFCRKRISDVSSKIYSVP